MDENTPFFEYLGAYCHVNGLSPNWEGELNDALKRSPDQQVATEFKAQMRNCILTGRPDIDELERAIAWGFDTRQEWREWLTALWKKLYDDEPI